MVACTAGFYTNTVIHLLIYVYVGCMYVFYLVQLFEAINDSSAEETLRFLINVQNTWTRHGIIPSTMHQDSR
ncbi:hypothetical protein BDV41DRAFT_543714 [Aspergillus transmontanensis]|uniref:Uncharacterized protein n=1 Tax=Aspergillus transmontanensis TaxID=1034304 RepID=A0A5N6VRW6_9EURO|nr:hypothetical protein BDV41DRAFT_543714 [Aspergillus transmontanensis]